VPLPPGETSETQEVKRLELCCLFEQQHEALEVNSLMELTFSSQRQAINDGTQLNAMLSQWPFLGLARPLLAHFRQLTVVDIEISLRAAIGRKSGSVFGF
jgi:hypothetical protein